VYECVGVKFGPVYMKVTYTNFLPMLPYKATTCHQQSVCGIIAATGMSSHPCSGGPSQSGHGAAVQEDRHPTQGELADV